MTGRLKFPRPLMPWGEKVHFIEGGSKVKPADEKPKWREGIFVGFVDKSNEYIIATPSGCLRSSSAKRMSKADASDPALFRSCVGTPWKMVPSSLSGASQEDAPLARPLTVRPVVPDRDLPPPPRAGGDPLPRRVYIRKEIELKRYGFTEGCLGCQAAQRGEKIARNHSEECRGRIQRAMEAEGDTRVAAANERREAVTVPAPSHGGHPPQDVAGDGNLDTQAPMGVSAESAGSGQGASSGSVNPIRVRKAGGGESAAPHSVAGSGPGASSSAGPAKVVKTGRGESAGSQSRTGGGRDANPGADSAADAEMGDEESFLGFRAFEEAEAERAKVDWQRDERECLSELRFEANCHNEVLQMMMQLGDQVHVNEVFSQPGSSAKVNRFGLCAGLVMDLRTGWDFDLPEHRQLAWKHVVAEQPYLLIGSPGDHEKLHKGLAHTRFVCKLYEYQHSHGMLFLHEHAWHSSLHIFFSTRGHL
ncbi:unnamed protein product [Prorocentrum cordatum]|uniref:Uncharacterized protein n=1 Tax=Prorocentrum cordatum TaxID=2364126 RepID=A0ABN9RP12_9DINO|nr:unnamed protein product [Polarella glacialis]